jgi:PDZ domain
MKPPRSNDLPAATGWLLRLALLMAIQWLAVPCPAQSAAGVAVDSAVVDQAKLVEQVPLLGSTSYRARQSARAIIEHNPAQAIEVIRQTIHQVDSTIAVQLVDILSGLAMHSDLSISSQATDLLSALADEATSVGRGSNNALQAIADLREEKAIQVMEENGAIIGYQEFSINGKQVIGGTRRIALTINDDFVGSDQDLKWIRFLKSIEVVYLNGSKVTPVAIEATSHLKQLKGLKLRNITITPELLQKFHDLRSLEQLGISYVDMDDSFVPTLMQLPICESLRLLGTKISEAGKTQLEARFVGVEIYRGKGGFLGISSDSNSCRVKDVTINSAAHRGGILPGDTIIAIKNQAVTNFDELRTELAKYDTGETVEIEVERIARIGGLFQPRRFTAMVTLQQEP